MSHATGHTATMTRRQALTLLGTLPLAAACATKHEEDDMSPATETQKPSNDGAAHMPVIFAAHGAPMVLDDAAWMGELAAWGKALPRPSALLVVSAHWEARPATLGATRTVPLVYDFHGFPERYYRTQYPAPGAPQLADRVRGLLSGAGLKVADAPTRGLDHGVWVPLIGMYPDASVPTLQLSLPGLEPQALFRLGQALAPLRQEGVLLMGSGFLTHNLAFAFRPGVPQWARDFDAWAADALNRFDVDALIDFERRAPAAAMALPTTEHYAPLLVAAGAAATAARPTATFPIEGFWMDGAFTRRSVQLG
jgi:4,5-DOPA dioxygenase extradiol